MRPLSGDRTGDRSLVNITPFQFGKEFDRAHKGWFLLPLGPRDFWSINTPESPDVSTKTWAISNSGSHLFSAAIALPRLN